MHTHRPGYFSVKIFTAMCKYRDTHHIFHGLTLNEYIRTLIKGNAYQARMLYRGKDPP